MVIAARRAYQDLIRWIKAARPARFDPGRLARRLFWTWVLVATVLLGAIGLAGPARFGSPTTRPLRGSEWWLLAAVVGICVALLVVRLTKAGTRAARWQETFRGTALQDHPSFEPALNALDACPAALRTRFGLGWVWGPLAAAALAGICASSAVYFVVDAILARFSVGWEQPLLSGVNAILSFLLLRAGAKRLAVWRLSFAVHRSSTRL